MNMSLDFNGLTIIELINVMNDFIKLKLMYWNVDFLKQKIEIDLDKIDNSRELKIISNDIYSSDPVIDEFKKLYRFFQDRSISINGTIIFSINKECDTNIIRYDIISGNNIDRLEYNKDIIRIVNKSKINNTYTLY